MNWKQGSRCTNRAGAGASIVAMGKGISYSLVSVLLAAAACGDSNGNGADARRDSVPSSDASVDAAKMDASVDAPMPVNTASRVWVTGDFVTNNTVALGYFDATATLPLVPTMVATLTSANAYAVARAGDKIAYVTVSDDPARVAIKIADASGQNAVTVFQAEAGKSVSRLAFSPDGTKLVFLSDVDLAGQFDLYLVNAADASTPMRLSPPRMAVNADLDVQDFAWSTDSKHVAFVVELTTNSYNEAWIVDTSVETPTPVAVIPRADITPVAAPFGVAGMPAFDAAGRVYFRARLTETGGFVLYRANADGTGRESVTLPARADQSVSAAGAFGFVPGTNTLVIAADAPTATQFNLYKIDLATAGAAPVKLTNATLASTEPGATQQLQFSLDRTKVAFFADYQTNGDYEPHVAALDGSGAIRLFDITVQAADTTAMAWARDGQTVYCVGDYLTNNVGQLFALAAGTANQTASAGIMSLPVDADIEDVVVAPKL